MKDQNPKLKIYQGIIQYLLDSTNYTLENIAELSNNPIRALRTIYYEDYFPHEFSGDCKLVRLYLIVLEYKKNKSADFMNYFAKPRQPLV